jgi:spore coat protein H
MNLNLKLVFQVLLFPPLVIFNSKSQSVQTNNDTLNLTDLGREIENNISFNTTHSNYENIKITSGKKITIKAAPLLINGDIMDPKEIKTRGQSTLYYRRKSYSFNLKSVASFRHGEKTESLKKFFVLSLSMDRNYCNNSLAFEMMKAARFFDLFFSFCELRINGQCEGIGMVIERPEDWAIKKHSSPLIIRRGYNISDIKTGKETEKDEVKKYRSYYKQIYSSITKYDGEELYVMLSKWLDIDSYLKWLAFNFLVRNGDYTDEVYFFVDTVTDKFNIIPWDYDDLFSKSPHEGNIESRRLLGDKLFFSTEDLLDKKIVTDPYLYEAYLSQFRELLEQLSADVLKRIFENTYAELIPYYSNDEIISKSTYDRYRDTNLTMLKSYMLSLYEQLILYREIYLRDIQDR